MGGVGLDGLDGVNGVRMEWLGWMGKDVVYGVGCKTRATIQIPYLRHDRNRQIRGLGGTCVEHMRPQQLLSAYATTSEMKSTTSLDTIEIARETVAESSRMIHDRGEMYK